MKCFMLFACLVSCSIPSFAAVYCDGQIKHQTIRDDIKIKKNCLLEGLIIHGDVILQNGSSLELKDNHLNGNIEAANNFSKIIAQHNHISGDVNFIQGKNIQLRHNQITGDLKLNKNSGTIAITDNEIAGNLICAENTFTMNGNNNQVKGNKSEQCRTF